MLSARTATEHVREAVRRSLDVEAGMRRSLLQRCITRAREKVQIRWLGSSHRQKLSEDTLGGEMFRIVRREVTDETREVHVCHDCRMQTGTNEKGHELKAAADDPQAGEA